MNRLLSISGTLLCLTCAATRAERLPAASTNKPAATTPQRLVALGPSLTRQLYLLGATNLLVGITTYCPQPDGAPPIERIGSVVDPNIERIVRLRPDLVMTTSLTDRRRVDGLRALGIPLAEFRAARTFDEICTQFLELGRLAGRETQAVAIVHQARSAVESLRFKDGAGVARTRVFIQIGARPLVTAGPDSFLNDLIEMAGGDNIAKDAAFSAYSLEAVLAANPECILIVTMGLAGPDERDTWRRYDNLAAATSNRIYLIASDLVCSPTPASFVEALALVAGMLHPK
ncbi:MAG: helical backbone metal receptor [Kiritimatiellae bacterium]|nr:helical backbone metal receptor [Kiritimatiellia bacterium]